MEVKRILLSLTRKMPMPQSVGMTTFTVTADDVATLLRMWRAGADLSIEQLAARVSGLLPESHQIGRESIRRYERGQFPAQGPDALLLAAIAIACGRRIGELPEEVLTDVHLLAELLRKQCFSISGLVAA